MIEIFNHRSFRGRNITEYYRDGAYSIDVEKPGKPCVTLDMYKPAELFRPVRDNIRNGHGQGELLDSGRDILAEEILSRGEPDYGEVSSLMPVIETKAYSFVGSALSWGGIIVAQNGEMFAEYLGEADASEPLFSPSEIDGELKDVMPIQLLVDGELPIMLSVHKTEKKITEFLFFCEYGSPDRYPVVWLRTKIYSPQDPSEAALSYGIVTRTRTWSPHNGLRPIEADNFNAALADTIDAWLAYRNDGAEVIIPEKELGHIINGTQMSFAVTFSGAHAHYGHKVYGEEVHDAFPPNYIWSIEMCCLYGRSEFAEKIWRHFTDEILTSEGRIVYRQGEKELYGASAEEYGQLLYIAERYKERLGADRWDGRLWDKLVGMGMLIVANCGVRPPFDGKRLVYMCAEADTNTRVHAYVNNNLWAVRGLNSLVRLLESSHRAENTPETEELRQTAALLKRNTEELLDEYSEKTRFGKLPPFRFGYTAKPMTLSSCRETFEPMTDEELEEYLVPSRSRESGSDNDLLENTYANYRYYPEMLSSMLLKPEYAEAIVKMRENIGGEYLAMTRFLRNIDNWPVLHYARYLIETARAYDAQTDDARTNKFLLLLFAHACHHGNPNTMCYFEHISTDGRVVGHDCVPSLLTVPIMSAWMFAYENTDGDRISLLKAVPKAWFESGFSANNIGLCRTDVSVLYRDKCLTFEFSETPDIPVTVHMRAFADIKVVSGSELIGNIEGNTLTLKKGIRSGSIIFE